MQTKTRAELLKFQMIPPTNIPGTSNDTTSGTINMKQHSMSCDFPERCSCGASEFNAIQLEREESVEIIASLREQIQELDYLKTYVIPEKDKHGKYWHDLAQERIVQIWKLQTEKRELMARLDQTKERL